MQVSLHNKVKSYNLTAGKSLPEWLSERRKNKRSTSEQRIELLHDLEFPHCARTIFRCPNGTHLFAAGDYPYRLKCFDVNALSMKYSFNADINILSGVCLSSDYRQFALRGEGRHITVHHSATIVDRLRVPHIQRCLAYNPLSAELLSSGVSSEVFRISLETGVFVESFKTQSAEGVNHVEVFKKGPVSGLMLTGGCDGAMEAWDTRMNTCAARMQVAGSQSSSALYGACEIRHVSTEESGGMLMACGLESGEVLLYDIRLQKPLLVKDHMNGLPIVKTYFFQGKSTSTGEASYVLSADTRSLKVWHKADGRNFTSIDAPADISDFCLLRSQHNMVAPYECDDSGVVAICCDVPRVQVHFIPQLGVAPRWASFLEAMTEELEEKESTTVYDDFTFIPKEELEALGISAQDMADGNVRPVMHGAFIENGLFRELKAVVDPAEFNRYLAANAHRKKDKRWEERISRFKRIAPEATDGEAAVVDPQKAALAAAKADPRFVKAFDPVTGKATSAAFATDRKSPEYAKLLQSIEERRTKASERRQRYESEMFSIVPDTEEQLNPDEGGDDAEGEDARHHLRGVQSSGKIGRKRGHAKTEKSHVGERKVTMFEVKDDQAAVFTRNDKQIHAARKKQRAEKMTLEQRLKEQKR